MLENILEEKEKKIIKFVNLSKYKPMKLGIMRDFLDISVDEQDMFEKAINNLINRGEIRITRRGNIISAREIRVVNGVYSATPKGFGFVILDNEEEDIFIHCKNTNGAMDKDVVLCQIKENGEGKKREGIILKIIEKGYNIIVGTFEKSKDFGFVVPDKRKLYEHIFIPKNKTLGAIGGHKVVIKITKNATEDKKPEGMVIEIIGHMNDPEVDILSIIKQFELQLDFDKTIYKEIENIPEQVLEQEIVGRLDIRNLKTVTIDGADAKDLDDAITIQVLEDGNYELGVHIADVTHYVKDKSLLNAEALNRATSVYLVDRVIPMLPHKLSNGICSLNANEDRLALSCIMKIDKETGKVYAHEIKETIINVDKRMTYNIVDDILINEESPYKKEYQDFEDMFKNMKILRDILLNKRIKRGAIEFDFKEAKIILDENRKAIDIKVYERNLATSIIEEFMLLANETVAEAFFWLEAPFVYRVHEEPNSEKIDDLCEFLSKIGYKMKKGDIHPKTFQTVIKEAKGKKEEMLVNRVILRSFKQAKYKDENQGHFGLAAKYYCHFTSPIRRYPDLQIHRIIKLYLNDKLNGKTLKHIKEILPKVCKRCSFRERIAEDAERETVQYKKVEYMKDKEGLICEGIVSGVTSWGIYVELENTIEGMVSIASIEDDRYIYDESAMKYVGEKTGNSYSIGDSVTIKVIKVSLENKTIDFKMINQNQKD